MTLRRADDTVLSWIEGQTPLAFGLRFAASRSMGELLGTAAEVHSKGCSCGCGGSGEAAFPGAVSIGVAADLKGDLIWSDPIGATIYTRGDGAIGFAARRRRGVLPCATTAPRTGTSSTRRPVCTGLQCTFPEVCKCGDDKRGNPMTGCEG